VALSYGADDLHGTIIEEHIFHMAGATTPQLQTEADMIKAIRETGCDAGAAGHVLRTHQDFGKCAEARAFTFCCKSTVPSYFTRSIVV
jgi:hypothetical protein